MAYSRQQRKVIRKSLRTANRLGASRKVKKALLEAESVEANFTNPRHGDRDSLGPLQQRPSQGWGSPRQVRNVRHATASFVRRAQKVEGQYGSAGKLAQAVQRSAFPDKYGKRAAEADAILSGDRSGGTAQTSGGSPGVDRSQDRRRLIAGYLLRQNGVQAGDPTDPTSPSAQSGTDLTSTLLQIARTKDTPARKAGGGGGSTVRGHGKVTVAANADRPGVKTSRRVIRFADKVSAQAGRPVTIGTGSRHSQMTVSGNVSDHWSGHAADIPATGARLIRLGRAALVAAGMPKAKARHVKGGLFNVGGHQIIFNTHEGGDHTNHLHISA